MTEKKRPKGKQQRWFAEAFASCDLPKKPTPFDDCVALIRESGTKTKANAALGLYQATIKGMVKHSEVNGSHYFERVSLTWTDLEETIKEIKSTVNKDESQKAAGVALASALADLRRGRVYDWCHVASQLQRLLALTLTGTSHFYYTDIVTENDVSGD